MGAWIEINKTGDQVWLEMVAPYMGAWIEISQVQSIIPSLIVAPYMGAWIEIYPIMFCSALIGCRSLHGGVD